MVLAQFDIVKYFTLLRQTHYNDFTYMHFGIQCKKLSLLTDLHKLYFQKQHIYLCQAMWL